jgi:hypothetical protein
MLFNADFIRHGVKGILAAGFYSNDWTIEN